MSCRVCVYCSLPFMLQENSNMINDHHFSPVHKKQIFIHGTVFLKLLLHVSSRYLFVGKRCAQKACIKNLKRILFQKKYVEV